MDKQERNKDENLIGSENASLNSIEGKRGRELVDVERTAYNAIITKTKQDLDWYKFQFFCIMNFNDGVAVKGLKVILGTGPWNRIEKECEQRDEQT